MNANDRCDRCSARAYVRMHKPDTIAELLFCNHHIREHEPALVSSGWRRSETDDGQMFALEGAVT